jgi:hypothetical protein
MSGPDQKVRDREMAALFSVLGTKPDDASQGNGDYYKFPTSTGIESAHTLVVDNCEIWGWSMAGISLLQGADGTHIHHCNIHHCQRRGLGYGVCIDKSEVLIESNLFDYCRHAIAGSGLPGTSYEARNNIHGEHSTQHCFDMHGSKNNGVLVDGHNISGEYVRIHHNTIKARDQIGVCITGVPRKQCEIHHNWLFSNGYPAVQLLDPKASNVSIHDNVVGQDKLPHDVLVKIRWQK